MVFEPGAYVNRCSARPQAWQNRTPNRKPVTSMIEATPKSYSETTAFACRRSSHRSDLRISEAMLKRLPRNRSTGSTFTARRHLPLIIPWSADFALVEYTALDLSSQAAASAIPVACPNRNVLSVYVRRLHAGSDRRGFATCSSSDPPKICEGQTVPWSGFASPAGGRQQVTCHNYHPARKQSGSVRHFW